MSAEIIPLHVYTMRDCSGNDTADLSISELRATAWKNFYEAEMRAGAGRELAVQRAEFFITRRFDSLVNDIRNAMAERG